MTFVTFTAGAEDYVEKGKQLRNNVYGFTNKLHDDDAAAPSSSPATDADSVFDERSDIAIKDIDYTKAFGTKTLRYAMSNTCMQLLHGCALLIQSSRLF